MPRSPEQEWVNRVIYTARVTFAAAALFGSTIINKAEASQLTNKTNIYPENPYARLAGDYTTDYSIRLNEVYEVRDVEVPRTIPREPQWIRPEEQYRAELNTAHKDFVKMLEEIYSKNYEPFNQALDYFFERQGFAPDGRPVVKDINGVPFSVLLWFNAADNQAQRDRNKLPDGLYSAGWGVYDFKGETRLGANIWRLNAQANNSKYTDGKIDRFFEFYKCVLVAQEVENLVRESGLNDANAADRFLSSNGWELIRRVNKKFDTVRNEIADNQLNVDWGLEMGGGQVKEQVPAEKLDESSKDPESSNPE